ncbi:hypothetical protein M405DRAFT_843380 [Rhizopogon salebrosus TDB-379]|nr:hypothetical protein M405DRAFT_844621 [Rhizopogon salebrosus TDB-379]KAJ8587125.1 hypothetical protein M405DRAFT_843380 [Rhizopogon salebrosus TDB-379]
MLHQLYVQSTNTIQFEPNETSDYHITGEKGDLMSGKTPSTELPNSGDPPNEIPKVEVGHVEMTSPVKPAEVTLERPNWKGCCSQDLRGLSNAIDGSSSSYNLGSQDTTNPLNQDSTT